MVDHKDAFPEGGAEGEISSEEILAATDLL